MVFLSKWSQDSRPILLESLQSPWHCCKEVYSTCATRDTARLQWKKALAAAEAAGQSSLLDVSNLFGIVSPNVLCSTGRGWSPYSYGFCPWTPTWIGTIQCCISSTIKFHVICVWVITPEVIPSAENSSLPNIFLVAYVSFMDFNDQKRTAVSFMISELWATWHTSRVRQAGKSWYCVLRVWFSTQGRDSADLAW